MNNFYSEIGRNISRYRKRAGLTQDNLADRSGISLNFLGQIERGTKIPSLATINGISKALYLDLYRLFDFRGKPKKNGEKKIDIFIEYIKEKKMSKKDRAVLLRIVKCFSSARKQPV